MRALPGSRCRSGSSRRLPHRFFKEKDAVENFLAMQVRQGRMDLGAAQRGIAADWTQFLDEASRVRPEGRCF
jgi:hypothetical protein